MSKSEVLRGFVTERLAAASQEILAAVDGLVAGYEEEASGLRHEIDRQRRQLEVLLQPRVILNKTGVECSRRLPHDEEDNEDEYDKNLDMNNRTPTRSLSSRGQLEQRKHSGPQISETQNHVDLRIQFQENPQTEVPTKKDVQYLFVIKEEVPPELSLSLDQEEPKRPNIKEEQEELWTSQEGEQLRGLEEVDDTKLPLTPVHVKNEDDEEKPQSSQPHRSRTEEIREAEPPSYSSAEQMEAEVDGENCGRSEPDRNLDPHGHLQPHSDEKATEKAETEDGENDRKETNATQSGVKSKKVHVRDKGCKSGEKTFSCSECGKKFSKKQGLQRHMKIHTGETLGCDVCGKRFRVQDKLNVHMRVHTGEKPFGCDVCGKGFKTQGEHRVHMRVHTGEKPFCCDDCGKRFKWHGALKVHSLRHTGEKPFGCATCGKSYNRHQQLKEHMKVHTGEKPFHCDVCGKNFSRQVHFKRHLRIHTGEKPFDCDVCGKAFKTQGERKVHQRVHTGEKPFCCDVCGKTFKWHGALKVHNLRHTGEKPYGCSTCEKSYSRQQQLKEHMKVHTGEQPFHCDVCGKKFSRQVHFKRHLRIHTGENSFGCDVCGKQFNRQVHLNRHLRVHVEEKPFSCSFCGKQFKSSSNCNKHKTTCKHKHVTEGSSIN